jgi:hypothetical protein
MAKPKHGAFHDEDAIATRRRIGEHAGIAHQHRAGAPDWRGSPYALAWVQTPPQ